MFKAVLLVAGFSVVTRFFGFLFKIYLGRELGAEMLGIYQVAFSVFMVLSVLVSSGLPLAVSKYTATQRALKNAKAEYSVATSALIIGLIVSVVICAVLFFGQNLFGKLFTDFRCMEILLTLLPAVIASAVYSAFRGSLWGRQDYFSVCWTELAEQILRILFFFVMAFWLFKSTDGATIAGWSLSIACICSALLVTIVYFKKGGKITKTNGYIKAVLKSSVPVTGVRTATSLIQPVIAVLFPLMLVLSGVPNESALALYGVIMGMTFPLLFLPSTIVGALSFTLIPELSSAIAKDQKELVENRVKSAIVFAVLISALFIPFYVGLGAEIGKLIFDNELIPINKETPKDNAEPLNIAFTGRPTPDKLRQITKNLAPDDAILITNAEEVSYLFNIRDFSKPYTAKVKAKAIAGKKLSAIYKDMEKFEQDLKLIKGQIKFA